MDDDEKWIKLVLSRLDYVDGEQYKLKKWKLKNFTHDCRYFCLVEYLATDNESIPRIEFTTHFNTPNILTTDIVSVADIYSSKHFNEAKTRIEAYAKKNNIDADEIVMPMKDILLCLLDVAKHGSSSGCHEICIGDAMLVNEHDSLESMEVEADLLDVR